MFERPGERTRQDDARSLWPARDRAERGERTDLENAVDDLDMRNIIRAPSVSQSRQAHPDVWHGGRVTNVLHRNSPRCKERGRRQPLDRLTACHNAVIDTSRELRDRSRPMRPDRAATDRALDQAMFGERVDRLADD